MEGVEVAQWLNTNIAPAVVYLTGIIVLYKRQEKKDADHRADYKSILDRYDATLTRAIEALTRVAERLEERR